MTNMPIALALTGLLALAAGTGCAIRSYPAQAEGFYRLYRNGQAAAAADLVTKQAESAADSRDALLWRLEQGTVLLAAGRYPESLKAFAAAEDVARDYDDRATVSGRAILREGAAAVTNLTAIPYYGTAAERIMLNTYKALACLRDGRPADAQVELRRAYTRQQEAVERYQREIAAAEDDARRRGVRTSGAAPDPGVESRLSAGFAGVDQFQACAVYVNPFTVYLDGLVFLATGSGGADLERAKQDFERVKAMGGAPAWLDADLAAVDARYANEPLPPTVHVIVEHGVAPVRREIALNLPVPTNRVILVSAAFPVLEFQPRPYERFAAHAADQVLARTELLASLDAVIAREFKHELPLLITRTVLATTVKTAAQYAAAEAGHRSREPLAGDLAMLALAAYGAVTSRADLRSWLTLPKEFLFARFPRPASGKLDLTDAQGYRMLSVELPPAEMTLVYVKVPSHGSATAQVIKLR